MGTWWIPIGW